MEQIRDKKFLREIPGAVYTELRSRHIRTPFRFNHKMELQITNTNGWRVVLGTFTGYQSWAEIWLDQFTAYRERKIYYCLHSYKKNGLKKLTKLASRELGEHYSIFGKDRDEKSDYHRLEDGIGALRRKGNLTKITSMINKGTATG